MNKKTADIWVKVYAILTWMGIAAMVFLGIFLIVNGPMIQEIAATSLEAGMATEIVTGTALAIGIVLLIFSVFFIFFAISLWKHKGWSRIVAIVFSVFSVFSGVFSLFTVTGSLIFAVILGLLIDIWFFYVFAFDKGTKELFKKKK